ncbi:hypothetical protein GF314_14725 [bacterium]|nr:hypothetical protein [bacterium]
MRRWLMVAAMAVVAVGGHAQLPNTMGMFFDDEQFSTATTNFDPAGAPFDGYIVLLTPSVDTIGGYELGISVSDPTVFVLAVTGPNGWTNFGGNLNHLVGYQVPLPSTGYGTVLATVNMLYGGTDTVFFEFSPSDPSSIPGHPIIADGENPDDLLACPINSAPGTSTVATLNGDGVPMDGDPVDVVVDIYVDGDTSCRAATSADATYGYDEGLDLPAAPESRLHFPHPEWAVPGVETFDQEYQPTISNPSFDVRTFTFEVVTELADPNQPESVQIAFDPDFAIGDGIGLNLVDRTAGVTLPVLEYLEYNYIVSTSETRTFDLMVGQVDIGNRIEVGVGAFAQGHRDLDNIARSYPGATDGWDLILDVPEPAPIPSGYVNATFYHPGWPLGPRFRTDTRNNYDYPDQEETWPLRIETDQTGPVTLVFWPNFHINDAVGIELHDPATDETFRVLPDRFVDIEMTGTTRDLELIIGGPPYPGLEPESRDMPASWAMVGMPIEPAVGSTLDDVLPGGPSGETFFYVLNDAGDYVQIPGDTPADRSQGYWFGTTEAFIWSAYEGNYNVVPLTVDLNPGWNIVGYPIWFPASLAGIEVTSGGTSYTWDEAITAELISPSVYAYDPSAQTYVPVTSMQAWQGYFLRALADDVQLTFDYEAMLVAPPLPAVGGVDDLPDALDWRTDLTLRSPDGPLRTVRVGVHPDATPEFDNRYDHPAPPRSPGGVEPGLYIDQPTRDPLAGSRFHQDLTGPNTSPYSWLITLEAPAAGAHTLSWDRIDWPTDHDLQIYRPDQNRVLVMSMRETDHLTLDLGDEPVTLEIRTPSLIGAPEASVAADRLQAAPNPFNPVTRFTLDLARAGQTRVVIYNARGQVVDRVELGDCTAGRHQVAWQARDVRGRALPSGVYFAAIERDGARAGSVVKLSLVR